MKQNIRKADRGGNPQPQFSKNGLMSSSDDADKWFQQAQAYYQAGKDENAVEDYSKAIELISENLTSEGDDIKISDASYRIFKIGRKLFQSEEYAKALAVYEKARNAFLRTSSFFQQDDSAFIDEINSEIENASALEANRLLELQHYDEALDIYNERLRFVEDEQLGLSVLPKRGDAYYALEQYEESIRCYLRYLHQTDHADETILDRILNIGNIYTEKRKYNRAVNIYEKLYQFVQFLKPSQEEDEELPESEIYQNYGKEVLVRLGNCYFDLADYEDALQSYLKVLENFKKKNNSESIFTQINDIIDIHLKMENEDKALTICENVVMLHPDKKILQKMMAIIHEKNKKAEQEKTQAITAERNKTISNLSHIITNLIVSTVVDPLEVLKSQTPQSNIVLKALKGANLVNNIVRAMNLSYKGSKKDFAYDAIHNTGPDTLNLKQIIIQGLKASIGNMYDGGYFKKFTDKYFPTDAIYVESKENWAAIAQTDKMCKIAPFLNRYFFKSELKLAEAENYVMGNERNSVVKMLILIQEMILNAVKYSVYINPDKRFLRISFANNATQISITVANSFKSALRTKTSGIGTVIIDNFASLLDTKPLITKSDTIYSVAINFDNFWKG